MNEKSYSELIQLGSFLERFEYLKIDGEVGMQTLGAHRYLCQDFYRSDPEWISLRDFIIVRDEGCDLAMPGFEINDSITIHHINPLTAYDFIHRTARLLDPENLITTRTRTTHRAIHYSNQTMLDIPSAERTQFDTCPWRVT